MAAKVSLRSVFSIVVLVSIVLSASTLVEAKAKFAQHDIYRDAAPPETSGQRAAQLDIVDRVQDLNSQHAIESRPVWTEAGLAPIETRQDVPTAGSHVAPLVPVTTSVLDSVADAYVDLANPTTNFGSISTLYAGSPTLNQVRRAIVQFNLPATLGGATIQAASLELYGASSSSSQPTMNVGVYRIEEGWNEAAVTWTNQPIHTTINKSNPVGQAATYYQWDVRGLVQDWVNGVYPNYGVMLRVEPETTLGWRGFNSRENSLNRPRLVITYTATLNTSDPQLQGLRRLEANSTVPVRARFRNGIPAYLHARVPTGGTPSDPLSQARTYLTTYKDLFRLTNSTAQFRLIKRGIVQGEGYIVLQQMHNNVPVYGAELGIHIKNNQFTSSNGAYLPDLKISTIPSVTAKMAEQAAKTDVLIYTAGVSVTIVGQTALAIFDDSLWTDVASNPRLVWRVNVHTSSADWTYFVDAQIGSVVHRLDLDPTDLDLGIYTGNNDISDDCWEDDDPSTQWYDEKTLVANPFRWRRISGFEHMHKAQWSCKGFLPAEPPYWWGRNRSNLSSPPASRKWSVGARWQHRYRRPERQRFYPLGLRL